MSLSRQTLLYAPGVIGPPLVGLAALVVFSRWLSPTEYGRYALVFATVELARVGLLSWPRLALLRFYPQDAIAARVAALAGFLASMVLAVPLWIAGTTLWAGGLQNVFGIGLLVLLLKAGFELRAERHRAEQRPDRYSLLQAVQSLTGFGAGAALVVAVESSAFSVLVGLAIGPAVGILVDGRLAQWRDRLPIDRALLRRMTAYGLPLAAIMMLGFVLSLSDRYMLAWLLDESAVGLYSVAYSLADRAIGATFMLVSMAALPLALSAFERDGPDATQARLRENFALAAGLGIPALVGLALVAGPLCEVLLGAEFRDEATRIVPWVALAAAMAGFRSFYFNHAFQLAERTGLQLATVLPAALANIVLNLWLIPRFGLMGAVYATVAAYAFELAINVVLGRRVFRLPLPWDDLGRPAAACVPMAAVLLLMPFPDGPAGLVLMILAGGALYAAGVWALNIAGLRR